MREILLKKALNLLAGVAAPRVIDLLWHTPTGVIDRRASPTIATLEVKCGLRTGREFVFGPVTLRRLNLAPI